MAQQKEITGYNIIDRGTVFTGNFVCNGDVRIDGSFTGSIQVGGKLIIGKEGSIKGDIVCDCAETEGFIDVTTIIVKGMLLLKSSAILIGDVTTDTLQIEQGAVFSGVCKMPLPSKQIEFPNETNSI
ncbi:MAG: polymer-forming cytoskeletal protein [Bacteroidales bacterium]|jgi:cytoskeletal protein CcmA (bactofilin family)|nr:polymer-forming cytoskeletal protein [Bacteroidales bacterium]